MLSETMVTIGKTKYVCVPTTGSMGVWVRVYSRLGCWYATQHPMHQNMYQVFHKNGHHAKVLVDALYGVRTKYSLSEVKHAVKVANLVDIEFEPASEDNKEVWIEEYYVRARYWKGV